MKSYEVLIVGSGHGGVSAASTLRHHHYAGTVAIITADAMEPYERPPLSKEYLAGEKDGEAIRARPPAFWHEKQIDLICSETVTRVDPAAHKVLTASGREFGYGKLVWAAGGAPRQLTCDGHDLKGLHTIRSRTDVDQLRGELADAQNIVVIGAGYIGLEVAASLTKLGKHVTVIEALDRVLARVAAPELSEFFKRQHEAHGVTLHLGALVQCVEGAGGRVRNVVLEGGAALAADLVIVGIGIEPQVAPLLAAGAPGANGVEVDDHCRTSLADVYAIGDCALHRNRFGPDRRVRIESVQNAVDQGMIAALDIIGEGKPYTAVPWFWSNQFDIKLQTVGLNIDYDRVLVRGSPDSGRFSIIYLRDGKVAALDCVNLVKDFVQGRALVEAHAIADGAQLTNPEVPLKSLVPQES